MHVQPLSTRGKVAITVACGLALAISTFWFPFEVGDLHPDLWRAGIGALTIYGFAFLGAFVVDRWWVLLPSITTAGAIWVQVAVAEPGTFETADPEVPGFIWALLFLVTVAPYAGLLLSGLLTRRLWDRRSGRQTATPGGVH